MTGPEHVCDSLLSGGGGIARTFPVEYLITFFRPTVDLTPGAGDTEPKHPKGGVGMSVQWRPRHILRAFAAPLVTAALAGAPGAAAASAANCQIWTGVPPPSPGGVENVLEGVAALSPCNVWTVGNYTDVVDGPVLSLAEHWNGTAWKVVPTPSPDTDRNFIRAVAGASASDLWAVGETGSNSFILHWAGTAWTQAPSPSPGSDFNDLSGVDAVSATDAWAVGQFSVGSGAMPLVLHWDGAQWVQAAAPAPGSDSVLAGVAAISAGNAWAVGSLSASSGPKTLIEHWNGTKWARVTSPNPAGQVSEITLDGVAATSASDVWAVGTYATATEDKTLIEHWNGRIWKLVPSPNPGAFSFLNSVAATSASNAWAVGTQIISTSEKTIIMRWNGSAWKQVPSPNPGQTSELGGVAATSATSVWAVGDFSDGGPSKVLATHCC